jgi:6-pyruvoyltetrahydropterin/6-carboxytetrahydropterin synthase
MEVRIDGWQKGIRFSSAHATLRLGKCERLHGHTYAIHCHVEGEPDERRVVFDFVEIVRALRTIADELDHFIFVPTQGEPDIRVRLEGDVVHMDALGTKYVLPRRDVFLLPTPSSTAEDLVKFILGQLKTRVAWTPNVRHVRVGVDEGYGQGAWAAWDRAREAAA